MEEEQLKLNHDDVIKYLIDNVVSIKARLAALELSFLAYVELRTPALTDKMQKAILLEDKRQLQKCHDDLRLLNQDLSDLLRKELDDLNS